VISITQAARRGCKQNAANKRARW